MFKEGDDFFLGQSGVEENRSSVFGEFFLAVDAIEQPRFLSRTIPRTNADVSFASTAVFFAVFILTTKVFQIVHDTVPDLQCFTAPALGANAAK